MAAFKYLVAFLLVTLANSATIIERLCLEEIIQTIKVVLAPHKMDSCVKYVPDIFYEQGAATFCKAAKVLGKTESCPNVNTYIEKIRLNIENLATVDCIIEEELPKIELRHFLDSLKKFVHKSIR